MKAKAACSCQGSVLSSACGCAVMLAYHGAFMRGASWHDWKRCCYPLMATHTCTFQFNWNVPSFYLVHHTVPTMPTCLQLCAIQLEPAASPLGSHARACWAVRCPQINHLLLCSCCHHKTCCLICRKPLWLALLWRPQQMSWQQLACCGSYSRSPTSLRWHALGSRQQLHLQPIQALLSHPCNLSR